MNEQDKQVAQQQIGLIARASAWVPPKAFHVEVVDGGFIVSARTGEPIERESRAVAATPAKLVGALRRWLDAIEPPKPETTAAAPAQGAK